MTREMPVQVPETGGAYVLVYLVFEHIHQMLKSITAALPQRSILEITHVG